MTKDSTFWDSRKALWKGIGTEEHKENSISYKKYRYTKNTDNGTDSCVIGKVQRYTNPYAGAV